jgi:hypothetical protein
VGKPVRAATADRLGERFRDTCLGHYIGDTPDAEARALAQFNLFTNVETWDLAQSRKDHARVNPGGLLM